MNIKINIFTLIHVAYKFGGTGFKPILKERNQTENQVYESTYIKYKRGKML